MKKLFSVMAAVTAVNVICVSAHGQNTPSDAIVVTATRTAQTADETLASVTVITRDDIDRRQPQDLLELLRTETGIDISRTGGTGGSTNLFMRGTNSNQVLVLIDGVRAASATTGTFELRSMSIGQIERIEIVRGPRASLYGSDAIGGVIQIFTRQLRGPMVAVGGGSFGSRFGRQDMVAENQYALVLVLRTMETKDSQLRTKMLFLSTLTVTAFAGTA
jgi:vitamin B12 transporter